MMALLCCSTFSSLLTRRITSDALRMGARRARYRFGQCAREQCAQGIAAHHHATAGQRAGGARNVRGLTFVVDQCERAGLAQERHGELADAFQYRVDIERRGEYAARGNEKV